MIEKTLLESWIGKRALLEGGQVSRASLIAYQLAALKQTLAYVKAFSPFYQKRLAGINPDDIRTAKDIRRLPFTWPDDIRSYGHRMVCTGMGEISRIVTLDTSGTTGKPKRIYFTVEDQELTVDFFHHGMSILTEKDDRVLILLPGRRPGSVGELLRRGVERIPAQGLIYGIVDDFDTVEQIILDQGLNVVVGMPQQIFMLSGMSGARQIKEKGCLHAVLLSADYVPDTVVQRIKARWGCDVYEHYGMTEMGLGGGVFCKARKGYHLREADMLFEIVDPDTGEPLPDGEYGEVVFSTLTRKGMPLIRYRTGDISRFCDTPCPCGTALRTMEKIKYRRSSSIELRNGCRLTMPQLDEALFQVDGIIGFEAAVCMRGGAECLKLTVSTAPEAQEPETRIRSALLESGMKDMIRCGELWIDIQKGTGKEPDLKGMQKRAIADMRKTDIQ